MSDETMELSPLEQRQLRELRELITRALRLQCRLDDMLAAMEEHAPTALLAELIAEVAGEIDDDAIPTAAVDTVIFRIAERQGAEGLPSTPFLAALHSMRVRVCKLEP